MQDSQTAERTSIFVIGQQRKLFVNPEHSTMSQQTFGQSFRTLLARILDKLQWCCLNGKLLTMQSIRDACSKSM